MQVEIIVLILCFANCLVFHHLLYCNKNVTFSGCISISNLQSSNRELAFVLETLFVVLYLERLLKVADLNSDRKVILLSTGRKKKATQRASTHCIV